MIRGLSVLVVGLPIAFTITACGAKFTSKNEPAPSASATGYTPNPNNGYYPTPSDNGPSINGPAVAPPSARRPIEPSLPTVNQPYPPEVAPVVREFPSSTFDPYQGLHGMGSWQMIDGERFFVPDLSGTQDRENWEPYQQGYWAYDEDRDWTWVSSDRWGGITDHYGVWRHHRIHGWIWSAFADRQYQPHCVTWFNEGEYVGWYPYHTGYDAHYRRFGANHGFDDGYWSGLNAVLSLNGNGFGFRIGITMVERAYVTQPNIRLRMVRDRGLILRIAHRGHGQDRIRRGLVGRIPGGDRSRSLAFIQEMAPHQIAPRGRAQEVVSRGGARIMQPHFDRSDRRDRADQPNDRRRSDGVQSANRSRGNNAPPARTAVPAAPAPTTSRPTRSTPVTAPAAPAATATTPVAAPTTATPAAPAPAAPTASRREIKKDDDRKADDKRERRSRDRRSDNSLDR